MKNRSAVVMVLLLAGILLAASLAGCAEETDSPAFAGAKKAFLEQWFELLQTNEKIYSGIFQTLEYAEGFAQDQSWESLLKARAAAAAALVDIRQMELPAMALTEEQIGLLVAGGVEVNAAQREFEALEGVRSDRDATALLLVSTLENDVFLTSSAQEALPAMTEFYQRYLVMEYRYLCQFTNYLLLQTDSADLWDSWHEQLPSMAACADVWYDSEDDVQAATNGLLDEMEALQSTMGSFLGVSEYTLEIVREAVETGDLETLEREVNAFAGVPGYFPNPEWLSDVLHLYMVTDPDSQGKRLVQAGEKLESAPSACYISCEGITLEDVQAYETRLGQWGLETYGTWDEGGDTYQVLVNSGSSTMLVKWTGAETLLYLSEPVGCLIPELYLLAMTAE